MVTVFVVAGWIASVCLHEFGHAVVAFWGGDTSVKDKGYLTLNPLRYTDPMLSIFMPILFLLIGGIGLPGGAVYIEHWRLRSRAWDSAVSAGGPAMSAIACGALASPFTFGFAGDIQTSWLWSALAFLAFLQAVAILINLLPVPPLDGYGILSPWLAPDIKAQMDSVGRYGIWIVFLLIFFFPPASALLFGTAFEMVQRLGVEHRYVVDGFQLAIPWRHG